MAVCLKLRARLKSGVVCAAALRRSSSFRRFSGGVAQAVSAFGGLCDC